MNEPVVYSASSITAVKMTAAPATMIQVAWASACACGPPGSSADCTPLHPPSGTLAPARARILPIAEARERGTMPQSVQGMFLNTSNPILGDINARKGLAHAINVQMVIDTLLRGDYEREHTVFSGYPGYTNPEIRAREFDLEKADEYLDAAGWSERGPDGIRVKDGQRFSILLLAGPDGIGAGGARQVAQVVVPAAEADAAPESASTAPSRT